MWNGVIDTNWYRWDKSGHQQMQDISSKDCMATVNFLSKTFDLVRKAFSCFLCYQVFKPCVQWDLCWQTFYVQTLFPAAAHLKRRVRRDIWISLYYCDRLDARLYFLSLFIQSIHTMATGTSNDTGLEELKEMVRQMGNRIDILSGGKFGFKL